MVVQNNIRSDNLMYQINADTVVPANSYTIEYNLTHGFRDDLGSETRRTNFVEGDPLFVDTAVSNFHLQATSPAIDNGSATDAPGVDYEANIRPQGTGYDIGAYEYVGA